MILLFAIILFVGACAPLADVRAGNRLGVLAPFEGLYRRSGYSALAAVRSALEGALESTSTAWLPVALDTSRDPARAAQKMLAGQNTSVVVGPLTPHESAFVHPAMLGEEIRWLLPFAQVQGAPVAVDDPAWLVVLVEQVGARVAPEFQASRLVIAGSDPIFTIINKGTVANAVDAQVTAPVAWIDAPEEVAAGDLLIWLGDAAAGVRFVAQARAGVPDVPVWLPVWAAGDVFMEHAGALPDWEWQNVVWGGWLPADALADESLTPAQAEALQVENAVRHAIAGETHDAGEWVFVARPLTP